MAEKIKVLISEEEVDARIRELGEKISKEYEGKQIHLICVLKGGVFFMCELAKRITVPGIYGLYVCWKLWRRNKIQWCCKTCERSGMSLLRIRKY